MLQKDGLTGIYNRSGIESKLDEIFAQGAQNKDYLSLVFFDIDFFKVFNDTYGHSAGDELLVGIAGILDETFGDDNFVGRYGGEEFVAIVPNSPPTETFDLAEEARRIVENQEFTVTTKEGEEKVKVTISGGSASYPSDARDLDDLIRKADQGLHRAKETGRNRICL